ncbi:hypothetical protein [Mycolicibacter arupensis]|uniref:hypothetical protein n=1 Tax=Mycolicibacter arupensis TaxID=342002 RepID=UPI00122D1289|nr:hypothetical protein [Mycolicibacter arupensis]KAA1426634.1 hypothetical protein F0402_20725 [Mycolicibacter arupensis]
MPITLEEAVAEPAREGIVHLEDDAQPQGPTEKEKGPSLVDELEQALARIPELSDTAPRQPPVVKPNGETLDLSSRRNGRVQVRR